MKNWFKKPFLAWAKRKPEFFKRLADEDIDPYLCGMVDRFSFWHRWLYAPYFQKVRVDSQELSNLKDLTSRATVVYVMKNQGQMEYSFFNRLFLQESIPLVRFSNGSRTLLWKPFKELIKAVLVRLHFYYQRGPLPDPLRTGYLETLVASGHSALLNLQVSRDFIFGGRDEGLQIIPPLLEAAKRSSRPLYLVTQQFLFDRRPDRSDKSFFDLLFGEKSSPGVVRKLILFLMFFRKTASVKFGEPFDLKAFVDENKNDDLPELTRKLKGILLARLMIERRSITGPSLQPSEVLLDKILKAPAFKEELQKIMVEEGKTRDELEAKARQYFKEMAASINYSYIEAYNLFVRWLVNNIYDGLDLDLPGLSRIKSVAGKHPIVLVPPHKSHIDYLLLSYIFYNNDLSMPHICAGINLKFWPVGNLLRKGGGFFIRRSLGGNKLYKLVLESYLALLVREGYATEFFIEGTRSRTGKLLKPKMGILSMIMNAFFKGEAEDIYFVPLSINYERILEEKAYVAEMKGAEKEKENVGGILKVRKLIEKKYGKVFVRFAEPISLKKYVEEKGGFDQSNPRKIVEEFAFSLTREINRVSVVTSSSLVAQALLSYPKKGIPEKVVLERAKVFESYLNFKEATFSDVVRKNSERAYQEVLQKFCEAKLISAHEDFHEKFYTIEESKRLILDYHKNNSLHFFVSLVCVMKILAASNKVRMDFNQLKEKYELLKVLLDQDFTFSQRSTVEEHLKKVLEYCVGEKIVDFNGEEIFVHSLEQTSLVKLYAGLLDNFFEASYITLLYLKYIPLSMVDRNVLEKSIYQKGLALYQKGEIFRPESLSQFNIRNALQVYLNLGFISKDEKGVSYTTASDAASMAPWLALLRGLLGMEEGSLDAPLLPSRPQNIG